MRRRFQPGPFGALCLLACALMFRAAAAADGPDDRIGVLEEKLDRSLKLIDQLSARVRELEAQRGGTAASGASAASAAAMAPPAVVAAESSPQTLERLASVEQQLTQLADANATQGGGGSGGIPLHGFADIGIGNHSATEPQLKGANVGTLDLFLNPQFGEHARSLFELTFEVNEHGQIESDLERAQIGYQFNDAATVWIGRFHTPFGYYNTAFHHGQEIATSLRRPRFIQFEDWGGVMPNHTVGAWLNGAERLPDGRLTYDLFVGNGQAIAAGALDARMGGVDHGGAIYGGNLGYVFGDALDGLKIGVSAFRSRVSDDIQLRRITRVDNAGVYFVYDTDHFEHIGEFYRFSDTDLAAGGPARRSSAGFLQLAWRLPIATPYVRYERAALDQSDDYFALQSSASSYYRGALGLRFDVDVRAALKLELGRTKNTDRVSDQWTDVLLDYAIRF